MRQCVDPDAQLAERLALLIHLARDAGPVQMQRGGQTPDPRAHDDDPHETLARRCVLADTSTLSLMRILVVDDDRSARESLRRSLAFNGFQADLATDGLGALAHRGCPGRARGR